MSKSKQNKEVLKVNNRIWILLSLIYTLVIFSIYVYAGKQSEIRLDEAFVKELDAGIGLEWLYPFYFGIAGLFFLILATIKTKKWRWKTIPIFAIIVTIIIVGVSYFGYWLSGGSFF